VIATNENDEFPQYLKTGQYQKIEPSRNCISSAMNVGHPSNLARLVALYGGQMDEKGLLNRPADLDKMRKDLWSISISDTQTRQTISNAYRQYGTLFEPHGAVGWAGLMEYLRSKPEFNTTDQLCISLETAHPAKFPEEIEKILSIVPTLPSSLEGIDSQSEFVTNLEHDYQAFKEYLLKFEERS
jgi:threonine synthase